MPRPMMNLAGGNVNRDSRCPRSASRTSPGGRPDRRSGGAFYSAPVRTQRNLLRRALAVRAGRGRAGRQPPMTSVNCASSAIGTTSKVKTSVQSCIHLPTATASSDSHKT
jgi:hypothetical protein